MNDPAANRKGPVRIELATSEIEGGPCRAWADPSQVLAAVSVSQPKELFNQMLQPSLSDLESIADPPSGDLPILVRRLLAQLQTSHGEIFRENQASTEPASSLAITCAVPEEDRIYFIKSSPAWICVLRGDKAYPVERLPENGSERHWGLGTTEKLRLEVTSLPVEPGDVVVLLCSEMNSSPDLRAVTSVFGQTADLKRACDGLVNLLGLQSEGAGAVAFRFIRVGAPGDTGKVENPLEGLGIGLEDFGLKLDPNPPVIRQEEPSRTVDPMPVGQGPTEVGHDPTGEMAEEPLWDEAEAFLDQLGNPTAGCTDLFGDSEPTNESASTGSARGSGRQPGQVPKPMDLMDAAAASPTPEPMPEPTIPTEPTTPLTPPTPTTSGSTPAPSSIADSSFPSTPVEASSVDARQPTSGSESTGSTRNDREIGREATVPAPDTRPVLATGSPRRSRRGSGFFWPVLLVVLTLSIVGLAAIPGGPDIGWPSGDSIRNLVGGSTKSATGSLMVAPSPPARKVYVDGEVVSEGTPTTIESIRAGKHRIGFDLGPCGVWETEVHIRPGEVTELAPSLTGSIRVSAADPSVPGKVWVEGGSKMATPATLEASPVGWVRIFYEDERLPVWERQVLVRTDRIASVIVPNHVTSGEALIKIESLNYWEGLGLEDSRGDSVWVDHQFAGVTPLDDRVKPGLHSVRVRSQFGEYHTEMLELRSGGTRHVQAQFGMNPAPVLRHVAPGKVRIKGPLLLTMEVESKTDQQVVRPTLQLPQLDATAREIPLSQIESGKPVYIAMLDVGKLPAGKTLSYFFTAVGPSGKTLYSDLYEIALLKGARAPGTASVEPRPRPKTPPKAQPKSKPDQPTEARPKTTEPVTPEAVAAQTTPATGEVQPAQSQPKSKPQSKPPTAPVTVPEEDPAPDHSTAKMQPPDAGKDSTESTKLDYPGWWP